MKRWFLERFLPMWAKETVFTDNRRLWAENRALAQKNRELRAYIKGLETGMRRSRKGKTED